MTKDSKTNWLVFAIIIALGLLVYGGYLLTKSASNHSYDDSTVEPSDLLKDSESDNDCQSCQEQEVDASEQEARDVLDQFQSYQTDRQASRVLSMMTEPETVNEENDLATIVLGIEDGEEIYRLYSANELTFNLLSYEVTSSEKIDDEEYWLYVSETRELWDRTTGDWSDEQSQVERKFEIIKIDDHWKVRKYTTVEGNGKYDGFSNVNNI